MKQLIIALSMLISFSVNAQTDSLIKLNEIAVKGYYNPLPLRNPIFLRVVAIYPIITAIYPVIAKPDFALGIEVKILFCLNIKIKAG